MTDNRSVRRLKAALDRRDIEPFPELVSHLLDTKAAAKHVGLSPVTLERFRITGEGAKFAKLGKSVRYRLMDLDAWVASRLVNSTSEAT